MHFRKEIICMFTVSKKKINNPLNYFTAVLIAMVYFTMV